MNLKEMAKRFDWENYVDGVLDSRSLGGLVRGTDTDSRSVGDYCRDWIDSDDRVYVALYLEGRPHWVGLEEKPYWPSIECDYISPAWYGKRQRRWYRWNAKFDVSWLYQGMYMNPHNAFPSMDKFLERYTMRRSVE